VTALQTRPRLLTGADARPIAHLVAREPILNCVVHTKLNAAPELELRRLGGHLWGVDDPGTSGLQAAVYDGGNLIPIGSDLSALADIAAAIAMNRRNCSSIVGSCDAVGTMWPILSANWGRARVVRAHQPLLVTHLAAPLAPDTSVRQVRISELDAFLPAAIAMFTEELETSPLGHDAGASYRARISDLIVSGRSFARFDRGGNVEFKAEIGVLSSHTAQIQGVWVRPDLRGHGLGTAAMAQVLRLALQWAPSVSLYVNEFNTAARAMYRRLGFSQAHVLSTVLF
jgi:predicted GNAT family acetyltransferase